MHTTFHLTIYAITSLVSAQTDVIYYGRFQDEVNALWVSSGLFLLTNLRSKNFGRRPVYLCQNSMKGFLFLYASLDPRATQSR